MNPMKKLYSTTLMTTVAWLAVVGATSNASGQDSVFIIKPDGKAGKANGTIEAIDPEGITVDGNVVPSDQIRKISIGREPTEMGRARDQFESGQYADCLDQLSKIDEQPSNEFVVADIDFMKAYSTAQISLGGGSVAPDEAGRQVQAFLNKHPKSYHLYPALEKYGELIFAFGRADLAAAEFKKMQSAKWTEYRLKGHLHYSRMMQISGNTAEAIKSCDAILKETGSDDYTQTYKVLAEVEKTKLGGLAGDNSALKTLERIVGENNSENTLLFAHINNAIGAVKMKTGDNKGARNAFLKTQLLYSAAREQHAEAIFHLAKLWPTLGDNDRANEARELLKSQYRNSYWAKTL